MARNDERRRLLTDAGIAVLAVDGARGLTHRAVDARAGVPTGTSSNYFRSRGDLVTALADRIGERLAPDPALLAEFADRTPDRELFAAYTRDIVRRLTAERDTTLALFALRLEGASRPEVADPLRRWLRAGFESDVAFNTATGLPGGSFEIALFHYAVEGLLFDRLTVSIDPDTPTDEVIDALVAGLLPLR